AVLEAAVVAVAHPRWGERPLATVVLRRGGSATAAELQEFLRARFPKFWVPDAVVFAESIPRTSAGKFKKSELRERYAGWTWATPSSSGPAPSPRRPRRRTRPWGRPCPASARAGPRRAPRSSSPPHGGAGPGSRRCSSSP